MGRCDVIESLTSSGLLHKFLLACDHFSVASDNRSASVNFSFGFQVASADQNCTSAKNGAEVWHYDRQGKRICFERVQIQAMQPSEFVLQPFSRCSVPRRSWSNSFGLDNHLSLHVSCKIYFRWTFWRAFTCSSSHSVYNIWLKADTCSCTLNYALREKRF